KANALVRYTNGPHSVSVSGHYITDYEDVRVPTSNPEARSIDSFMTWDATYGVELPWDMNVAVSVFNIADEAPPEVWQENFYDAYTHSPYGRMIKVGFVQRF
ncbi:MAG: TonB-dependent receptor, partial [Hyphomonadaceae bacterium]